MRYPGYVPSSDWNTQDLMNNPVNPETATSTAAQQNLATKSAQVQANVRNNRPGPAQGNPGGGAGSGAYGTQGATTPGSQAGYLPYNNQGTQYGVGEYGANIAMQSPQAFFDVYSHNNFGLPFGSATANWLGQTFDPYSIAQAFGGGSEVAQRLGQGTQFMNIIGQPGLQTFDPKAIVSAALQQFAKGASGDGTGLGSQLLGADPYTQLESIVNFLGQALQGTMDPKVLQTYLQYIQNQGMQIVGKVMTDQKSGGGGLAAFEKGNNNMATRLLQMLGPAMGM